MRMNFGRWNGTPVSEVPSSYLRWMLREVERLDPHLRRAGERELRDRGDVADEPEPRYSPPADIKTMVRSWHRRLVLEYHPDRRPGGSDEGMRAITRGYELLLEILEIER